MVRSTLQKRTASALLLTTIAVQLHVSGALALLQSTPVFAPIIGVASVEAQSTGNFQQENADPKYGKTWIVVLTCRNAAGQNVTYNQGGSSHSLAAMVRQSIVNKGLNLTQPLEAIVRSDGGTGAGFNWNDNSGTIHQPTVSAVCQILGNVGDTYVSSTCRDNERSGIYPNGKCNFHSPGDNNMHRFVGTFASPQCSDGLDNDGDGLRDFPADPGCVNAQDNDEFNQAPTPQCSDGIDNDGDGAADMQDFSCSSPTDNDETNPKAACQDGIDNDGDGLTDFPNDPGCQSRQDNDEFHQVACPAANVSATFEGNQGPWEDVAPNGDAKAPTFVGNVAPNSIVKVNSVNGTYSTRIYHGIDELPLSCDNGTLSFTNNSNQSILKVKLNAIGSQGITVPNGATRAYLSHDEPGSFNYFDNSGNRDHRAPCQVSFGITPTSCQQPQCRDGLDNDGDGLIDFPADPGCANQDDNDESPRNIGSLDVEKNLQGQIVPGQNATYVITVRNNGTVAAQNVNVYDYFLDNQDLKYVPFTFVSSTGVTCSYQSGLQQVSCPVGTIQPGTTVTMSLVFNVPANHACSTQVRNRVDAWINGQQAGGDVDDVTSNVTCLAQCRDGIDNDNDGRIDFPADPGCSNQDDNTEGGDPACADRQDNDGDGLIDFPADPGCVNLTDTDEFNQPVQCPNNRYATRIIASTEDYDPNLPDGAPDFEQNLLGAPGPSTLAPSDVVDFDNNGSTPGYVVVGFAPETKIVNRAGTDFTVYVGDFLIGEPVEAYTVYVSNDGTNFVNVGSRTPSTHSTRWQREAHHFDLGSLTEARYVKIQNNSIRTGDQREGVDIDAIEITSIDCDGNEQCQDGIDNDGDGATDFPNDFSCSSPTDNDETNPRAACQDGVDNDQDGLVDFPQDPGCVSRQDNDEFNQPQCPTAPTPATFAFTQPQQLVDYLNSLPDSLMPQKTTGFDGANPRPDAATMDKICDLKGYDDVISSYSEPAYSCGDNTLVYWNGSQFVWTRNNSCALGSQHLHRLTCGTPKQVCVSQCSDGIDNDGDGATDMQDFSCSNSTDNDETNPKAACQDGVDNDQDGLVDFPQDPGCVSRQDNDEFNQAQTIDLATQKTGPASVTRGQPILYTLTVRNNGAVQATNLVVTDPIPAGLVYNDALSHSTCSQVNNAVVCTHPSLGVGQTGNFTVAFDTPAIANCTAPVSVINSFSVTATQQDSNPGNNTTSTVANPTQINCPQVPQCRDGIDNDNDGATDFPNDFSCTSPDDNDETNQRAACQDGVDNDQDGLVDFPQDPGCVSLQDNDEFNQAQTADLSVTKTGPASVTRGQVLRYTITVRNNGPIQATNLVVTDAIPAGLQYNDAQSHSTCSQVGSNVVCTHPSLGANQNGSFTIAFDTPVIANCTPVNVVNSVTVSATQLDGNQSNNTASTVLNPTQVNCPNVPQCRDGIDNDGDGRTDTQDPGCSSPDDNNEGDDPACADRIDNDGDTLIDFPFDPGCASLTDNDEFNAPQTVDLSITKTAPNPNTVTRGQPIFYMIQVGNGGQVQATNVVVTDQVPAGLQYNDALSYGPCALVNNQVSCAIGTLNAGQFGSFFIAFDTPAIANCTPVTVVNSASISATQQDSNQSNNTSSTVNTPTQVNCPNVPQCRDNVDNDGDGRVDMLDPGCSGPDDNNEGDDPACSDRVDNDGDNLIDFPFDPGCANAQDTDEFNQVQTVDVSITKTAPTPSTVVRGQPIFYVITVGNGGTAPAPNVTVTDAVPAGLAFNDAFSYGPCDAVAGQVVCQLGTLAPGQFGSFILTFDTPAQQNCTPVSVVNTATIATTAQDSNQSNNTSSTVNNPTQVTCPAVTQCTDGIDNDGDGRTDTQDPGCSNPQDNNEGDGAADLSVSLVGPQNVQGGSNATYVATIANGGPDAVTTPFSLTVNVPAGVVYNAASSTPGCVQNGQTVVCPNITLPAGQQTTRTIVFTVPGTFASATNLLDALLGVETAFAQAVGACNTTIQVTAMVQNPANPDPNSANNQSTVSTFISCQSFQCSDGQDNDFDGRVDFPLDPGCTSPQDTNEGDEAACQDRRDNDGDGLVDWPLDPGCTTPVDTDEANAPLPQCADGIDNDNDGRIDIFDPGCSNPQDNNEGDDPACSDRIDNDNDGRIDWPLDPGCTSPADTDETNAPLAQCSDGIDNDFDGKVDFPLDPGCQNAQDPNEADDPVQYGCIEIVKQTFDPHGSPLPISAQFTFILDATRVAYNDSLGNARFDNVLAGQHAVAEIIPSGWTQLSITPANGVVTVAPGTNCARITFQNRQVFVANAQCSDGYDNDGDGLKDYPQDTGCTSATDNDEYNNTVVPQCRDGVDNDGDNLVDFPNDPGCQNADDNNEQNQTAVAACADNLDNDGDGLKDYPQDPGCSSITDTDETNIVGLVACNDNVDNDGDGLKDFPQDPGCVSATDTDESNVAGTFACNDNVDNDGDGVKDFPQDPGCSSATDTDEFNFRGPRCSDGIDNDADGKIDFPQDTGCTTPWDDNEWNDRLWLDRWREWWNWNW